MNYRLAIKENANEWSAELFNEFDRLVSWDYSTSRKEAVLGAVVWNLIHAPGDTREVIRALLNALEIE